jgi:translation initiation factor 2 alpha subunit (eIF-2alpha)
MVDETKGKSKVKTLKLQDSQLHNSLKQIANESGLSLEECVNQAIKEFVEKYEKDYKALEGLRVEYYTERMKEGSEFAKVVLRKMGQREVVRDFVIEEIVDNGKKMIEEGMSDYTENFLKGMVNENNKEGR